MSVLLQALRDSLDNIYDAKVPKIWLKTSWSSSTLGFWFTEFLERTIQFSTWCFQARPNSFWMTGFFNPQGKRKYFKIKLEKVKRDLMIES